MRKEERERETKGEERGSLPSRGVAGGVSETEIKGQIRVARWHETHVIFKLSEQFESGGEGKTGF
jgi:hypothetical protein